MYRESPRLQDQLTKATPKDLLGSADYLTSLASIRGSLSISLADHARYYADLKTMQSDWSLGAKSALATYAEDSANVARQMQQATGRAFQSMEDQLVSLATTGKANFKILIDSVIGDITRLTIRQNVTGPLAGYVNGLLGGAFKYMGSSNNPTASNYENSMDRGVGWGSIRENALGGVYQSPSLSAYSGQVHDKPQLFAFAKGAGVFGEAGPEAIMPLRRGSDGRLGVSAGGGGMGDVIINNYSSAQVGAKRVPDGRGGFNLQVLIREVGEHVENLIADNIGAGIGPAPWAIEGRYGLRQAVN